MQHFLAERYVPPADRSGVAADVERLRSAARVVAATRLLEGVYLPGDELCLYLFESESAEAVAELSRLAGLEVDRIRQAQVER